jgi:hypothetical protein
VPLESFDRFWGIIDDLLSPGGRVLFDFPSAAPTTVNYDIGLPEQPTNDYTIYRPENGVSFRDHEGRRWRVVHVLWDVGELSAHLGRLGWCVTPGPEGWFAGFQWLTAQRA